MNDQLPIEPPKVFTPPASDEVIWNGDCCYYMGPMIGQGAFGAVYECMDDWANDLVAKVILPQERTYEQVRDEWLKELTSLMHLRHPNITYVHDAFEYRDTFYLIIERCSQSLNDLLAMPGIQGEIWLPYVASDILQALHFLHGLGYVHKDLHPGNIFISHIRDKMVPSKDPVIQFKIGDLGISRLESDIRVFGTILAQWMLPPEFLDSMNFGVVGRQVDIYHVGLLLLRLITGNDFTFNESDIVNGIPRQIAENHSSPFAPVVAKALRRHVDARTQSALELWRDISSATRPQ